MSKRGSSPFLVAFLACLSLPPVIFSQPRVTIRDSITCAACRLTLERVVEIGGTRDSVILTVNTRFIVSPDGARIFAFPTATPGVIAVYGSRGTLIRTMGREGRGPGEFTNVFGATLSDGRLYVIDKGGQRINVFGPALAFEREIKMIENLTDRDGIIVVGNRVVISSVYQTPPTTPAPVAMLDFDGARIRTVSPEPDSVPTRARRRYLAESRGDRFWVAPFNRYELQLWDTAGRQQRTIVRDAPWFRPYVEQTSVETVRPQPQLKSVREDDAGLLWVALLVADLRWAPVPLSRAAEALDGNRVWDTRIEALDPRSASLLATYTTDNVLGKVMASQPMFSSYRTDANGYVIWTLHRPRLQRPRE